MQIIHVIASCRALASSIICKELICNADHASELLQLGAVYRKKEADPKPIRLLYDTDIEPKDYLRIHSNPRRYPTGKVQFSNCILDEKEDYLIVNKPPGIPSHGTVDNLHENFLSGLSTIHPDGDLYLPHRLDTDTSGLMVIARNKEFTAYFSDLLRYRLVTKRYKALLAYSSEPSFSYLKSGYTIFNYMEQARNSPKIVKFESFGNSLPCLSSIRSVSSPVSKSAEKWIKWSDTLTSAVSTKVVTSGDNKLVSESTERLRKAVHSWCKSLSSNDILTFQEVELELITGRTHQIRAQLHSLTPQEPKFTSDTTSSAFSGVTLSVSATNTNEENNESVLKTVINNKKEFPYIHIAGDNMYQGCTSSIEQDKYRSSDFLALQAYEVEFPESFDFSHHRVDFKAEKKKVNSPKPNVIEDANLLHQHFERKEKYLKDVPMISYSIPSVWWQPLSDLLWEPKKQ